MQWINDGYKLATHDIGKLPVENSSEFTYGNRCAVAWTGNKIKIRIPWTLLYFRDPTQMAVIDGAISQDGGYSYVIHSTPSDGIAVSVYLGGNITSSTSRYSWPLWITVPATKAKPKKSLDVVRTGLSGIEDFTD
jgi:hypothetical protein